MGADSDEGILDIAEVAGRSGLAPSALRYYEESGLIKPTARKGLRRQYESSVLLRLGFIRLCQDVGFTLPEIASFLGDRSRARGRWRHLVRQKLASVEDQMGRLALAREMLTHASDCESRDIADCPHFQQTVSQYASSIAPRDTSGYRSDE